MVAVEAESYAEPFSKTHSFTLFITCDVSVTDRYPCFIEEKLRHKVIGKYLSWERGQWEWVGSLEGGGRYRRKERSRGGGGDDSRGSGKEAASLGSVTCLSVEPRSGAVKRQSSHAAS